MLHNEGFMAFHQFNPLCVKRVEADTKRPITKQTLRSTDRKYIVMTEGQIEIFAILITFIK
jgi:hypothetical protein